MRIRTVFSQIRCPNHHYSSYSEDNSLLIQFMIVEFIHTAQLSNKLKCLIQKHLKTNQSLIPIFPDIKQIIEQLIREHPRREGSDSFPGAKGSLAKLKEYCGFFSHNSSHQNKHHLHLHLAANQALLTALHIQETLTAVPLNVHENKRTTSSFPIKGAITIFQNKINQIIRRFPQALTAFWDNENVVFCIFRLRQSFIDIYGTDVIAQQFKTPAETKQLMELLCERYRERGFDSLIPTIHQLIEPNGE